MAVPDLMGSSVKFRAVLDQIQLYSPVDSTVLVQGETGTGKEVVARAIHEASPRRNKPFVALNCAAMPSALIESELFGHERGAFTGAVAQSKGRFQAADHGTLFLDEIGDLPLELQPKLLRVLQEREFERLGSTRTQQVDVRVIAATNQDLYQMVEGRRFRADLYYRLSVVPITLPPLRERSDDIPLLVSHFVRKFADRQRKTIEHIPDWVMEILTNYDWPGNVRELQNVIERAVIRTEGSVLRLVPDELNQTHIGEPPARTLRDAARAHIIAALRDTRGVIGGPGGAATRLGVPRTTLLGTMKRLGISQPLRLETNAHPNSTGSAPNWFVPEIGNTPDFEIGAYANRTEKSKSAGAVGI